MTSTIGLHTPGIAVGAWTAVHTGGATLRKPHTLWFVQIKEVDWCERVPVRTQGVLDWSFFSKFPTQGAFILVSLQKDWQA